MVVKFTNVTRVTLLTAPAGLSTSASGRGGSAMHANVIEIIIAVIFFSVALTLIGALMVDGINFAVF
jgi:hypothetical protein